MEPLRFEQLYGEHFSFGWRVLRHLGLPDAALRDASQELWLVVYRRLPSFDQSCHPRSWLFGIAVNVARNHRRSELRRGPVAELPAELPGTELDPEALQSGRETWLIVQSFLGSLPELDRCIFVCNVLERLSADETARALGIGVATVYQRVRTLKRAVRKRLGG
jgi:RNA polymerase sigma-70 factor (ECF subfamily)